MMLSGQRERCLKEIHWNQAEPCERPNHVISVLECWKPRDATGAVQDSNYRFVDICREKTENGLRLQHVEHKFEQWLNWQGSFAALSSSQDAGVSRGGIRLVFCERSNTYPGMSISETTFLKIEEVFQLHPATLPSFLTADGVYALFTSTDDESSAMSRYIKMVIKLPQKIELGNFTISLCYDTTTGWTNAFVCGEGILTDSYYEQTYGSQLAQLTNLLLAEPQAWDNPLFLPFVVLQNYIYRLKLRMENINDVLSQVETEIGVTFAGLAGYTHERQRWPQDVDTKNTTIAIHSVHTQTIYIFSCCKWIQEYGRYLLAAAKDVHVTIPQGCDCLNIDEYSQTVRYLLRVSDGVNARFLAFKERATMQANVLFNVINQQQSILSQQDMQLTSRIAKSSRQDSISMTTFTFLTALFLPGTFVSAMFSMGMFNWQSGGSVGNDSALPSGHNQSYVASNFWIYWALTVPLTLATMISWYVWSRYANKRWLKELSEATDPERNHAHSYQRPYGKTLHELQLVWGQQGLRAVKDGHIA